MNKVPASSVKSRQISGATGRMNQRLQAGFQKSGSRYLFNVDRISEKYCSSPQNREVALETLRRNFGEACISSPVLELGNEIDRAACRRLNEVFETTYALQFSKSISQAQQATGRGGQRVFRASGPYNNNCSRSGQTVVDGRNIGHFSGPKSFISKHSGVFDNRQQSMAGDRMSFGIAGNSENQSKGLIPHFSLKGPMYRRGLNNGPPLAALLTNSVEEEVFRPVMHNAMGNEAMLNNRVASMLTHSVNEGPYLPGVGYGFGWRHVGGRSFMQPCEVTSEKKSCGMTSRGPMIGQSFKTHSQPHEPFFIAVDETHLEAWFRTSEPYWYELRRLNCDRSFRRRLSYEIRRGSLHSIGYTTVVN